MVHFKNATTMLFWIRMFLLLMLLGQGLSCSTPESALDKVFDNTQLVTVNRIIDFYDNFVLSRTDKKLSIDKAYLDFLNTNCPKAIESGYLDILIPDRNDKVNFYKTLDREELSEIYVIQDTVKLFDRNKKEPINTYLPYSFRLNTQGKYVELLKLLATRNDFYKEYYK